MSTVKKNLSTIYDTPSAKGFNFGLVVSEWNQEITESLLKACTECLKQLGATDENLHTLHVPGAFELPLGAKWLAGKNKLDAIICLGCIIKGDTQHDEYIAKSVSSGIMSLNLALNMPIIFGVLTPNNTQQALDRAGGKHGNKGVEAATTAVKMIYIKKSMADSEKRIGF